MTYHNTPLYGSDDGKKDGPDAIGNVTPVTFINGYADSSVIYGIELKWGSTSRLYGEINGFDPQPLDCTSDPICQVKVYVDSTSGYLLGVLFKTVSNTSPSPLILGDIDGSGKVTAFDDVDDVLTNMTTYRSGGVLIGIKFRYTGPSFAIANIPRELAFPALAALAHTAVVTKSLMKVGKLRRQLAIKPPSCDPPLTISPADARLWYRTFHAQENCKEALLVYLPSILIASTLGYHAFGKWVPRTVGTLTFAAAFFRLKYLNTYIGDADKRGKPFLYSYLCMRPVFFIAVASSGYLLGKGIYEAFVEWRASRDED